MVPCGLQLSGVLKATSVNRSVTVAGAPPLRIPPPLMEARLNITRSPLSIMAPWFEIPPPSPALLWVTTVRLIPVVDDRSVKIAPPEEAVFLARADRAMG